MAGEETKAQKEAICPKSIIWKKAKSIQLQSPDFGALMMLQPKVEEFFPKLHVQPVN